MKLTRCQGGDNPEIKGFGSFLFSSWKARELASKLLPACGRILDHLVQRDATPAANLQSCTRAMSCKRLQAFRSARRSNKESPLIGFVPLLRAMLREPGGVRPSPLLSPLPHLERASAASLSGILARTNTSQRRVLDDLIPLRRNVQPVLPAACRVLLRNDITRVAGQIYDDQRRGRVSRHDWT